MARCPMRGGDPRWPGGVRRRLGRLALSTDLATLLAFRALGLSAGVGMIVGRAVIRDLYHGHDAQRLMSQVSMLFGIAPAIAPIIGGWILLSCRLAADFLVPGGVRAGPAGSHCTLPAGDPSGRSARAVVAARVDARLRAHRFQPALPAPGAGRQHRLRWHLPVHLVGAGVRDAALHLGEGGFAWLFIPTIGGMTTGSFLSGRMAHTPTRQVAIGFSLCALSALLNVGYVALSPQFVLPWAVLPIFLGGMALIFPSWRWRCWTCIRTSAAWPRRCKPRAADDQHRGGRRGVAVAQCQPAAPGAGPGRVLWRRLRVLVLGAPA